jgi:hypothetical protein
LGEALDGILADSAAGRARRAEHERLALEYVANISGTTAVDRIVGELRVLANAGSGRERRWTNGITRLARRAWHRLKPAAQPYRKPDAAYQEQKFPGLEASEVTGCLETLGRPHGRFGNLQVSPLRNTRFCYWVRART